MNPTAALGVDEAARAAWQDAMTAAALLAVDPEGLGGALVRTLAGPVRERWIENFLGLLPQDAPVRRAHPNVDAGRLLGGLDLAATLRSGRPQLQPGLLAESHAGVLLVAMSERLPGAMVSELCSALDNGEILLEREGFSCRMPARFGVILMDEGCAADEGCPAALADRVALHVDLSDIPWGAVDAGPYRAVDVAAARRLLPSVAQGDDYPAALCQAAARLGVASLRAVLQALRASRAAAALFGADSVTALHAQIAARLVLGPRAGSAGPPPDQPEPPPASRAADDPPPASDEPPEQEPADLDDLTELLIQAASAVLPEDPFAAARRPRLLRSVASGGRVGPQQRQGRRGRPGGSLPGQPRAGQRLDLLGTLRAAAPWQRLRRTPGARPQGIRVEPEDLRVKRFTQRAPTATIFAVDASGSAAMQRLAEAKGAIELLLADCYVRRDQVALIAFRGRGSALLLPPTRSLVRAKRQLARLVGGGGTPLAAGVTAAADLADQVLRRGVVPFVVLLTDGRANVTLSGEADRRGAEQEALTAAGRLRALDIGSAVIDTSPRGQAFADRLAGAMSARYCRLPVADAGALARQIQAFSGVGVSGNGS